MLHTAHLGGPLAAAAGAALAAGLGAAGAVTWPLRSALFLVFMSSVTLRSPDVTAVPCRRVWVGGCCFLGEGGGSTHHQQKNTLWCEGVCVTTTAGPQGQC